MKIPWWIFTVWIEGDYDVHYPPMLLSTGRWQDDGWRRHVMRIQGATPEMVMEYVRKQMAVSNPGRTITFGPFSHSVRQE